MSDQWGGLSRRATVIRRLRSEVSNALILDGGNLSEDPAKMPTIVEAMAKMGYQVCRLGALDTANPEQAAKVVESLRKEGITPLRASSPAGVEAFVVLSIAGRQVGMTAVGGNEEYSEQAFEKLLAPLDATLLSLRSTCDLVILLSQLDRSQNWALAERYGASGTVDLILGGKGSSGSTPGSHADSTWIPPVETRGRGVTVIDVDLPSSDRGEREARSKPLAITARLETIPKVTEVNQEVQRLVDQYYAQHSVFTDGRSLKPLPDGLKYPPPGRCQPCHVSQYRIWTEHKHSHALEPLIEKNRLVPECLQCHSEQFRQVGRVTLATVGTGKGSDDAVNHALAALAIPLGAACVTCHGDGTAHITTQNPKTIQRLAPEDQCRACHTAERDPLFDYKTDLSKVKH